MTGDENVKIALDFDEKDSILDALNVARYFYEKLNRIDDARKVERLQHLLIGLEGITVDLNLDGLTKEGRIWFDETLRKREAILHGTGGEVVELYRPLPIDEDDPNEVSAEREVARIAREYARDMKKDK